MSAKGVSPFAQVSLQHDVYKCVLRIGSWNHWNEESIIERFRQINGMPCSFGHFGIRDRQVHGEILKDDDLRDEERQKTPESSPAWSTLIRDFTVSPASNVPLLSNYDADRERCNLEVETQIS